MKQDIKPIHYLVYNSDEDVHTGKEAIWLEWHFNKGSQIQYIKKHFPTYLEIDLKVYHYTKWTAQDSIHQLSSISQRVSCGHLFTLWALRHLSPETESEFALMLELTENTILTIYNIYLFFSFLVSLECQCDLGMC